ncbi:PQQ-like beta-propeller repeat protein [Thalassoglobus polymorphus]|uniref:Outer membrane biogenesis protein BamB n=1 Tax=Thalassoglobus polymorphus TaxID=2527994 RepID=A0A517QNU0_9PLAN|nr:PQQ-like beta-propeller repeat protein [Thalassoglobus polymorphus]QDT33291.1 outer membrane biogenesis protein BamB [Thalassoglobus polymorphus]
MMRRTTLLCVVASIAFTLQNSAFAEENWPYWRGPDFTNTSAEKNLPAEWDPKGGEGSNVIWAEHYPTRSTPTLMNDKLYILTTAHPEDESKMGEKVVCIDSKTGKQLWEYAFNVYLSDVPAERVGWSSVTCDPASGNVYALGVCGYFCCLNGETGEVIWDRSLHEEFGLLSTYGGRTNFPLVYEDNVIISAVIIGWGEQAKPAHRFICFDKNNGVPIWFEGTRLLPDDTTYSAPVLAVIEGELQMIFASGDGGVYGFQPRTGKQLWKYMVSGRGINTSPLVVGNKVYCGHSEENLDTTQMGAVFCIDATKRGDLTKTGEVWRQTGFLVGRSSPVMIDGRLYCADDRAKLHCFNPETGEVIGKPVRLGTMMRSNLLVADGKIYAHTANGRGYILKPTEDGAEILYKFRFQRGEESHGTPIVSNGRIFIPTTGNLYCIGLKDAKVEIGELPPMAKEKNPANDEKPATVVIAPVESLLLPGDRQPMQVRLYNSNGQFIRLAKPEEVEFELTGPGMMDEDGAYNISKDQETAAATLMVAKVGEISGNARIRVIPQLPWSIDFDNGVIPVTWVGARYRHIPLDFDLLMKLKKDDQLASDLYIYFMTQFKNVGPKGVFDDSTPRQTWTALLSFTGLADGANRPKNIEDAKKIFGAALQKLTDEKVLSSVEWSQWERPSAVEGETVKEPRLTVTQGERKIDGNGVMCKITTIPKGARSQGWMGHPDFHDYTIEADVYAFERNGKLPDIGLVGQRYTLDMMGASNQLQFRTWTPQMNRFSENVPFVWEANKWYTMKFQTQAQDGKAILKAKVWVKGEEEPAEWTITATDEIGNEIGSPGLFGNAKDSEIFYDNLKVTKNK